MGIEDRRASIESAENEADKIENKTDELEREAAEQKALAKSINVPEDCAYLKSSVENATAEAIYSYAAAEIITPADNIKKDAANMENEASHDLSNLEDTKDTIDIMKSSEKNIHSDLDGVKADTQKKVEIADEQTRKAAELRHQMVDSMIRANRL